MQSIHEPEVIQIASAIPEEYKDAGIGIDAEEVLAYLNLVGPYPPQIAI